MRLQAHPLEGALALGIESAYQDHMKLLSHFGVYALILSPAASHILVIKKRLGCYTGLYDLPGGTMEPHELLEHTLLREVLEETSCTITNHRQLATFSVVYPFKRDGDDCALRHIGTVYHAEITGTPRETAEGTDDDSDGCVWLALEAANTANSAPFVLDAIALYLREKP